MIWEGHRVLPTVPDRWGYHLHILHTRQLPDAPIPQIEFLHYPPSRHPHASATLGHARRRASVQLDRPHQSHRLDRILLETQSHPSITRRRHTGRALPNRQSPRIGAPPLRLLGRYHRGGHRTRSMGQSERLLPHSYERLSAHRTHDASRRHSLSPAERNILRVKSIADPAGSGTGRMLLLASNVSLSLYGIEVDALVRTACLINGALYAPWLAFPFPNAILHGK
jgi:hypothetical protein